MAAGIPRIVAVTMLVCAVACAGGCAGSKGSAGGKIGELEPEVRKEAVPAAGRGSPGTRGSAEPAVIPAPTSGSVPGITMTEPEDAPSTDQPPDFRGPEQAVFGPPEAVKIAYLTFDDGPSGQTEKILELLGRYGVKATFFVTGKDTEHAKALYKRIAGEGHGLGNHTYSHDYTKLYRNADVFMEDVRRMDRFLRETVGRGTDILRFPGGSNTRLGRKKGQAWIMPELVKKVRAEGYQYFDWNVTSTDAAQTVQPKSDIVSSVLSLARGKERVIVLMHDISSKTTTVEALPEVIRGLKEQGFRFKTLTKGSFTTQFLQ